MWRTTSASNWSLVLNSLAECFFHLPYSQASRQPMMPDRFLPVHLSQCTQAQMGLWYSRLPLLLRHTRLDLLNLTRTKPRHSPLVLRPRHTRGPNRTGEVADWGRRRGLPLSRGRGGGGGGGHGGGVRGCHCCRVLSLSTCCRNGEIWEQVRGGRRYCTSTCTIEAEVWVGVRGQGTSTTSTCACHEASLLSVTPPRGSG